MYIRLIKVNTPTWLFHLNYICPIVKRNQSYIFKILVSISLLLLLLFLAFWNMENYKRTKIDLEQTLNDQMSLVCGEYRDSMVQSIFQIITSDSLSEKLKLSLRNLHDHDSLSQTESLIIQKRYESNHFPDNFQDQEAKISITIDATDSSHLDKNIIVWQSEHSSNLRYNYSSDTIIESFDSLRHRGKFPSTIDRLTSSLPTAFAKLDSLYTTRLQAQNILIPHSLTKDTVALSKNNKPILVPFDYQSFGFDESPIAVFEAYQSYIWKKMSSSILMSFILFGVVALSFFALLNTWLKQQRLASIKNEFVSNMTHELKTPISTIGVAIEALENYGGLDDPIKTKEYLNISKHEVNRLKILVDKVLKMSTIDQSERLLNVDHVDIKTLTESMLNSMQLHFEKHGVALDYQCEDASYMIKGDKIHLTNVLYNLIDNAIKYSGENPEIGIKLDATQNEVIIKVLDKGMGINKAYQTKIFDRFFRVPTEDIHNVKGYGLGLHYVKTVINKHGGNLELKSELGKGSLFIINLPKT
jgi:signal transduction histidine kinase